MSAHTYGWADLDAKNGSHYGRGKPAELLDAEQEMELAWGRYDRTVDNYYDRDIGTFDDIQAAKEKAEKAQDVYTDLYNRIYGKAEQETPIGQQLDGFYKVDF